VTNRVHVMTFAAVLVLAALAPAQTFSVLYRFTGGLDGGSPFAGVIQDPSSNLYGTTSSGGDYGGGVVYKVDTAGRETVLHSLGTGTDGAYPLTPVAREKAGNIYGSAYFGGSSGYGTIFKIDTAGNETTLYSFTGGSDGCYPEQGLVGSNSGTLYGTTGYCGSAGYGTVFKIDSTGKFTLLYSFAGYPSGGANPRYGHLAMDNLGNLYGVTEQGGDYGYGVLYKLSKDGKFTVLHSFAGGTSDGCTPYGSLLLDKAGNLYGTTWACGSNNYGTIWKASKKGKETILHNLAGGKSDGCDPAAGVARDPKGNLYGVAYMCGANNYGALYKLSASGKLTLLHSFDSSAGAGPTGEVLRTANGTLFGTASGGGTNNFGTVWSYVP